MKEMREFTDMKSSPHIVINNQRGSVINVALLILILIFLVGIGLHKISTTDIKIAGNMKTEATTFYEAEAGLEAGSELVELNAACPLGFLDPEDDGWEEIAGSIMVTTLDFWRNDVAGNPAGNPNPADKTALPEIDAFYPPDYDGNANPDAPHTNISVGGKTRFARGSAIQMAAGYEGLGKGAAAGGASIIFDIYTMRYGENRSQTEHMIQWNHLLLLNVTNEYCK
jgi:hypothetical protein